MIEFADNQAPLLTNDFLWWDIPIATVVEASLLVCGIITSITIYKKKKLHKKNNKNTVNNQIIKYFDYIVCVIITLLDNKEFLNMPRKHLIASQTNKKQQQQAKMWQKLSREIKAAVKVGGPNQDANPRLKAAVEKALQNNLSRESIARNIAGNQKDASELFTLEYECYGPNGLQIIVSALTDNQNRTSSNLKGFLSKLHAEIAKPNSVRRFFEKYGVIIVFKSLQYDSDKLLEMIIDYQIVDIIDQLDAYEILVDPKDFYLAKNALEKNSVKIFDAEIKLVALEKIELTNEDEIQRLEKFIENCENDDDIQWVITNNN